MLVVRSIEALTVVYCLCWLVGWSEGAANQQEFKYLGCFADSGVGRDFSHLAETSDVMTTERCHQLCSPNYLYFATQYGIECYCSNKYGLYDSSYGCNVPCKGNSHQTCGGSWANSVYQVLNSPIYQYVGCYADQVQRDLPRLAESSTSMTIEKCYSRCYKAYDYFAVQYGTECFCSNSYGKYGTSSYCNVPCSGNNGATCGGPWANSLYRVLRREPNKANCNVALLNQNIIAKRAKVYGVNLGSWLILEAWMVNLWQAHGCNTDTVKGQYQFERCVGSSASWILENHWSTWITEDDFRVMSANGINAVRVPIGWWHIYDPQGGAARATLKYYIQSKEYAVGSLKYLDKAFEWGSKYGIGILLDMHAPPGSQNGADHSSPEVNEKTYWYEYPSNTGQTIESLIQYAQRYARHPAFLGFELMNEPITSYSTGGLDTLKKYYTDAYTEIRKYSSDCIIVISGDLWDQLSTSWATFMIPPNYHNVWMDWHPYACFDDSANGLSLEQTVNHYVHVQRRDALKAYLERDGKGLVIGEWSGCNKFNDYKVEQYINAQAEVFGGVGINGWFFWSWKTGSDVWSLKNAIEKNMISPDKFAVPCIPNAAGTAVYVDSEVTTTSTVTEVTPLGVTLPVWAIVLIVIACLVLIAISVTLIYLYLGKRKEWLELVEQTDSGVIWKKGNAN